MFFFLKKKKYNIFQRIHIYVYSVFSVIDWLLHRYVYYLCLHLNVLHSCTVYAYSSDDSQIVPSCIHAYIHTYIYTYIYLSKYWKYVCIRQVCMVAAASIFLQLDGFFAAVSGNQSGAAVDAPPNRAGLLV